MCMAELTNSVNIPLTNLIRRDLAFARNICSVLRHATASVKLNILTYLL